MLIYLLTHQREQNRKTNTGALVEQVMKNKCKVFVWERTKPDKKLLEEIRLKSLALVYPSGCGGSSECPTEYDGYIIIDATWQEAQKMYNHSPYLKDLPKVSFNFDSPSIYTLRRNQKGHGLCTAECAAELLRLDGQEQHAARLEEVLSSFIASAS